LKFTNLTRRTEIGANSNYLELAGHGLVLDCGMHPKNMGEDALPNFKALLAAASPTGGGHDRQVDAILISHAHQDHIGTLPVLMRRQPRAAVFMTEATAEIGSALLHNSVNVMTRQREELGPAAAGLYPLFTHRETDSRTELWRWCPLRQPFTISGERATARDASALTFEFFDAGHVLGSSGILLRGDGRTVFYTGDVNFDDQTIMEAAIFPEAKIDILIMECTRGDHAQPENWTRTGEERRLAEAIVDAFARGGCVLIPVFALGKTQELLAMLYKFRRESRTLSGLGDCPIYIGGLSSKMTEIYDRRANMSRRQLPRVQLMDTVAPFILNGQNIRDAPTRPGRVYALSSGMMTPNTLSNIFARRIVENPRHSIFFVGYADPESPAGLLRNTPAGGQVRLEPDGPTQRVRCNIKQFQFSAHASRETLIDYANKLSPKKIVLVHGDPSAVEWMRATLTAKLPNAEVIVPTPGVEIEL
jgi:Cft2 family RNA processing exonuclease